MHPFAESSAHAALANLDEAIETLRAAGRARSWGQESTLVDRARAQAINAAEKLRSALTLDEMAVTCGEEREAAE